MATSSGGINFDNQQMSSPLTTLLRKASTHRPNNGSADQAPTQPPHSPLIHTKFRGSVATTSSYDTSRFQDDESAFIDVRTSTSTVRISSSVSYTLTHPAQHPNRQPSLPGTRHQPPYTAGSETYAHPSGSIPAITIHPSPDSGVSLIPPVLASTLPIWLPSARTSTGSRPQVITLDCRD